MDTFIRLCHNCNKEGAGYDRCSKCKIAHYCSRECQVNNWCTHKYNCNLTPVNTLADNLIIVTSNVTFKKILKALVYHFLAETEDQMLACMISKLDDGNILFSFSFLIFPTEGMRNRHLETKDSRVAWLIHFGQTKGQTSEGGYRFNLESCKESYDALAHQIDFTKVKTTKDTPLPNAEVSFNDTIYKDCRAFITVDGKCLFEYD